MRPTREMYEREIDVLKFNLDNCHKVRREQAKKIAELEEKVDALQFSLDKAGTSKLKAGAIREMANDHSLQLQGYVHKAYMITHTTWRKSDGC